MDMSLQTIYFYIGVAGFALAAICAISAIAYFLRADIRGVLADLSGKTRAAELAEFTMPKRGRGSKKSVLVGNEEWTGSIAQGDLAARSGSDAITEDPSLSGSGASSDWSYSDSVPQGVEPASDVSETMVESVEAVQPAGGFDAVSAQAVPDVRLASEASASAGVASFEVTRQIISVHSASVINEQGNEVSLASLVGGER